MRAVEQLEEVVHGIAACVRRAEVELRVLGLELAVLRHHVAEDVRVRGRRVHDGVCAGLDGLLYGLVRASARGDDGHGGEVLADVTHDLGRLGAGGDVEDGDAGIEACLHVLVAGGDGRDDGDVDDASDEADVGVAHGGVHDHGERALGFCVLRDDDGAHAARGAAADAHEDGADRGADDGLRDGLLRRERVDGEHGVRVAVADDRDVRGEHDGLDAAPHDDHALGLVDDVRDLNGVCSQRAGDAWDVVFVLGCGDHAFTFPSGVGAMPPWWQTLRRRDYGR